MPDMSAERVLIVEDHASAREGLVEQVRDLGFAAEGAADGTEAPTADGATTAATAPAATRPPRKAIRHSRSDVDR